MADWCAMMISKVLADAVERVVARVRELLGGYAPPSFAHVPDPDAAIFLCAVDHRTGYRGRHLVGGRGAVRGQRADVGRRPAGGAARAGLLTAAAWAR